MKSGDPLWKSPAALAVLGFLGTTIATAALSAAGALWSRVSALENGAAASSGESKVRDHYVAQGIEDLKADVAAVREQLNRKLGK